MGTLLWLCFSAFLLAATSRATALHSELATHEKDRTQTIPSSTVRPSWRQIVPPFTHHPPLPSSVHATFSLCKM